MEFRNNVSPRAASNDDSSARQSVSRVGGPPQAGLFSHLIRRECTSSSSERHVRANLSPASFSPGVLSLPIAEPRPVRPSESRQLPAQFFQLATPPLRRGTPATIHPPHWRYRLLHARGDSFSNAAWSSGRILRPERFGWQNGIFPWAKRQFSGEGAFVPSKWNSRAALAKRRAAAKFQEQP